MWIANWNLAGLRARLPVLLKWLELYQYDIICLQEIKCDEEKFTYELFEKMGYKAVINGQRQFNGVAILYNERIKLSTKEAPMELRENGRFIEASFNYLGKEIDLCCLYAPNGNPINTEKFDYKISWLNKFYNYVAEKISLKQNFLLAGDFNIIPQAQDAKNIKEWLEDSLYSYEAREIYHKICNLGCYDSSLLNLNNRFTFWDYRNGAWKKNNGIRIDFIIASFYCLDIITKFKSDYEIRGWEKSSDHCPIAVKLGN